MNKRILTSYILMLDPKLLPIFDLNTEDIEDCIEFLEKYGADTAFLKKQAAIAKEGLGAMIKMGEWINSGQINTKEFIAKLIKLKERSNL